MSQPKLQASRRVAGEVLLAVDRDDAYANLLLPARIRAARLSTADAGLATELCYGALRAQGRLDRIIELASGRAIARIDPPARAALRLGIHQLIATRIAPHAAVGESVELVRALGGARAASFVNAVLRRVSELDPVAWSARILEGLVGDERLGMATAHPAWVVAELRAALDADGRAGELESLLAADNISPTVTLVALPGLSDAAELGESGRWSPLAAAAGAGDPAAHSAVREGRARVQDEGSQLAALALSRARPVASSGELWLDLCAGPGGKAAVLGAEAALHGARLVAGELVPARAGLVKAALAPIRPAPEVVEADARELAAAHRGRADRVLLDAPCSGLGALRRRPEARWRKSPHDLPALAALQSELLDAAADALAPGGLLAYVTCSPVLPETREQLTQLLLRRPALEALDTPAILDRLALAPLPRGASAATGNTAAQLWPHAHGTDAMFVQLLRRTDA